MFHNWTSDEYARMDKPRVSVVIPAYNEAASIGDVVAGCRRFCDEIIVVDDGSMDETAEIAERSGAVVVRSERNLGITRATEKGLERARGDVVVTMDADGQHDPMDIPRLIGPIIEGKAEVTLGVRGEIPCRSERMINVLTNLRVKCLDVGTGFRAVKAELARKMKLHGVCLCGTFILEAHRHCARIMEIPIRIKPRIYGKRKIKTRHVKQFFYVLRDLIF